MACPAGTGWIVNKSMGDHAKFEDGARNASLRISRDFKHNLQGCVNLFNTECEYDLEDFKKFPWISTYPTVLELTPSINTFAQEDTVLRLVKEKQKFNDRAAMLRKQYSIARKKRVVRKAEKRGIYSNCIIGMANHLETDPDKFFTGEYNWYFTGGILDVLEHELHGTLTFWALGSTLNELRIAQLGSNAKSERIVDQTLTLPFFGEVHQVSAIAMANELCAMTRQKNIVTILKSENLVFNPITSKTINSPVPFVSAFIENENGDFLYILDVESNLKKWDIRTDPIECITKNLNQVNKFRPKKKTSNWATIHNFNAKYFVYADRQQVKLINKVQLNIVLVFNLDDFVSDCSEICAVALSEFPSLIYVATTHDCFAISMTVSGKKRHTLELRWTHQLTNYPMLMKTCRIGDNTELVIVSSSISGDLKILCNERETRSGSNKDSNLIHLFRSYYIPYNLKNSIQLYNLARLRGKCLNATIPTLKRIKFSTCGVGFVKDTSDTIKILTANSVGDIFIQELLKSEGDLLPCIDEMESLEQRLSTQEISQRFVSTGVVDLKPLQKVFRSRQFNRIDEVEDDQRPLRRCPKWKRRVRELRKYTDILAQDMLAIWEFSDEEDEEKIVSNTTNVASLSMKEKVGNWLESMHQDTLPEMVSSVQEDTVVAPNQTNEEAQEVQEASSLRVPKPPQKKRMKKAHVGGF